MSTPCTTCGEPLDAADARCPTCGALASPAVEETAVRDAPPWSIPIREPAEVAPREPDRNPGRAVAMAGLAVVVLVLTVVVGSRLLGDDDPDTASRDTADDVANPASAGIDGDAVTSETTAATTTTAAPTTTEPPPPEPPATTAATTTVPPTTAAPTTTAADVRTPPNGTGSVPALSTSFRGWLAQLRSVPYTAGTTALAEEWERTRATAPGVVALRSNDWAGLGDGFWVLVDPGPFSSKDAVQSYCTSADLDADDCLARELRG